MGEPFQIKIKINGIVCGDDSLLYIFDQVSANPINPIQSNYSRLPYNTYPLGRGPNVWVIKEAI